MHSIQTKIDIVKRFEKLSLLERAQHMLSNSREYNIYIRSKDYLKKNWPPFKSL